jgi:hypothetical protein
MPGHYNLWVIAKGYITFYNEYDIFDFELNVNVYLRPVLEEKLTQGKPNALIKGHVFDEETQEPIAGAKVLIVRPERAFQPELLDEKPAGSEKLKEKTEGTRGEDCECEKEERLEKLEKEPVGEFYTTTDRNGYFELKVPSGVHALVVISPEYYKAVEKFVIEPEEEVTVRVPMTPLEETGVRPLEKVELDGEESSETDSKGSGWIPTGAEGTGAMLNAILAGLLVVMVILSMFVFRKYKRKPISSKQKAK